MVDYKMYEAINLKTGEKSWVKVPISDKAILEERKKEALPRINFVIKKAMISLDKEYEETMKKFEEERKEKVKVDDVFLPVALAFVVAMIIFLVYGVMTGEIF